MNVLIYYYTGILGLVVRVKQYLRVVSPHPQTKMIAVL